MIPFGLSQLMTVSLPIGRRATKCFVPGATAIYLFNEGAGTTLTDLSGNDNHGTFGAAAAAPTWTVEGLSFDGGDRVVLPDIGAHLSAGATFQAVIKPGADVTTTQGIVSVGNGKAGGLYVTRGTALIAAPDQSAGHWVASGAGSVLANTWIDIAGTIDWGTGALATYINGASNTTGTTTGAYSAPIEASNQLIGGQSNASWRFTGAVAAVLIYPFALSAQQIAQNAASLASVLSPRGIDITTAEYLPDVVLFSFDDGHETVYDTAYPILDAAGFAATAYVNTLTLNTSPRMSTAEITALDAAGWDIGNHTHTHAHLDALTEAEQETELSTCAAALDALGLTRASKHVAYPWGGYNADTLTAMAATGMLTGRTTSANTQTAPFANLYELRGSLVLKPATTLDAAKAYLHSTIPGRIVHYYSHIIDPDGDANGWTTADFQALVAYVESLGVRVVTISQLWDYVQAGYVWP